MAYRDPNTDDVFPGAAPTSNGLLPTSRRQFAPFTGDPGYPGEDYIEIGDPDDDDDDSDDDDQQDGAEQGRLRKGGRAIVRALVPGSGRRMKKNAKKRAARARPKPAGTSLVTQASRLKRVSDAAQQKSDPYFMAKLNAKKELQKAAAPDVLFERYTGLDNRVSGEVPPNARLRPSETQAVSSATFLNAAFAPANVPFTVTGPTELTLAINAALAGFLPAGTLWTWLGDLIRISSPVLTANPVSFTLTRTLGGVATTYMYSIPSMTNLSRITQLNGRMVAALPRVAAQIVTVDPVPALANSIVISGLPTAAGAYAANLRFIVPGDTEVEGLLRKLS